MSVKNVKIRFNLNRENDRRAYEYLQGTEASYSTAKRSFLLSADIWSCPRGQQPKTLSLKGLYLLSERKPQKSIHLAVYYSLCRHHLHKHPPKQKTTPELKQQCLIFSTTSKGAIIPAFDGTVTAIMKRIVPTKPIGSTILQY